VRSVGIIVNPWAGKDVRRFHAPVGHTPDTAKIGIVRRVVIGALEAGAGRVFVARDVSRIAERAVQGIEGAELVDGPGTGSPLDTRRAATQFAALGCRPVVVLGGDGTCRDVVIGWPDVTLIPISTGTNNVFPRFIDGSSAGTAAGLVASGAVDVADVAGRSKRLVVDITAPDGTRATDIALVDAAVIDDVGIGARAVVRPTSIRLVVAAIAEPASTGLSAVAGRTHPLARSDEGAVAVHLAQAPADAARQVHVPIVPGSFDVLGVDRIELLADGGSVSLVTGGVLAYDGERDRVLSRGSTVTITVDRLGPTIVDVEAVLRRAAQLQLFDVPLHARSSFDPALPEAAHGH
jgi:hypothetical protein